MRSSKYYQRWLQIFSRSSDVLLFMFGYFLGKDSLELALLFLLARLFFGFTISELMYKRMQAVVKEESNARTVQA